MNEMCKRYFFFIGLNLLLLVIRNSRLKLVAKRFCKLSKADRGKSPHLRGFKIARCTEVVANIY